MPFSTESSDAEHLANLEASLRTSAQDFPGAHAGPIDTIVARGRRARTVGRAVRVGVLGSLMAGAAFASPALLGGTQRTPTVLNTPDESVVVAAPSIAILSPHDGARVSTNPVTFSGEASRGAVVNLSERDLETRADANGRWRIDVELDDGTQTLKFWATADDGRRAFDTVTVTLGLADEKPAQEPKPAPTTEVIAVEKPVTEEPVAEKPAHEPVPAKAEPKPVAAPVHAFTSHQRYGSCSEAIPYDEFWGTATPGTKVWVYSEYGEKKVEVNGDGNWSAHVEFAGAPVGTPISVKTKSLQTGEKIFFEFVNEGSGGDTSHVTFSADMENNHVEYDPPYGYWSGTAPAGTNIWVASEYGSAQTQADGNGNWRTKVWFEEAPYGTKTWAVVVESSNNDRAVFEFTGTRPEPAPEPDPVAFTSDQVHDVTDDTPPHSRYVGTATPGTKIHIWSEYGEGYVHADDNGNWDLWVEFPDAPRGQSFAVHVQPYQGGPTHTYELQVI